jgi:trigger factor
VMPVFDLPTYKGLTVTVPKVTVSDADVTKELDKLREQNAMVIDKKGPAEDGNIVNIDYVEIGADGNEVASTARKDFTFTLGSGYNYYELDKEIEGMNAGDEKTIEKSYPSEFKTSDLAGKIIKLKVTMKSVKVKDVPALDDEFAQDVKEEYKTVADLTKATREKLEGQLKSKLDNEKFDKLADDLAKSATIALPASMVDFELDRYWKNYVRQTGLSEEQLEKYLAFQKKGREDVMKDWRPEAEKTLKIQLIMDKIKETENFTVSKEDLDKECETQLKDVTDESQKEYYRSAIEDDMKFHMVSEFLEKNNTFTEGDEKSFDAYMNDTAEPVENAEETK